MKDYKTLTIRIPMDLYLRFQRRNLELMELDETPKPMTRACLEGMELHADTCPRKGDKNGIRS
jgi:hypothetical protein